MSDDDIDEEKLLIGYPIPITIEKTEIILEQMKKCICKIQIDKEKGTGFFCNIPYENKKIHALMTNNHIIDKNKINNISELIVTLNDDKEEKIIKINKNRKIYTSKRYDTTIIELKKEDKINNYLEFDNSLFKEKKVISDENIYIIQYPMIGSQKASVSYGLIKSLNDGYYLTHLCSTNPGSSGSPILNISNNKIIGIHRGGKKKKDTDKCGEEKKENINFNIGTYLKDPLKEYLENINIIDYKKEIKNEIKITLKIEKDDINNKIYFLDNTNGKYNIGGKEVEHYHDNLEELNKSNTKIYIYNKEIEYIKYFSPTEEGIHSVKLIFDTKIKDCSFMFYNCNNIIDLDLSSFDTKNIINMSYMFSGCENLKSLDLSDFYTKNVTNMNNMFCDCNNLIDLNLTSFDTKNVTNMSNMFSGCDKITNIDLSSFDTKNVTNMSNMFYDCKNLKNLNLSNFVTSKVTNMSDMFYYCSNITDLNLSSFNTENVTNMSNMFYWCKNLKKLDISNFDTNKATNMSNMFAGCNNLSNLNISSFDIKKDYNTRDMFNYCNMTSIKIKKDSNETLVKQIPNKTTIVKK